MRTGLVCPGVFRTCVKTVGADKHAGFLRSALIVCCRQEYARPQDGIIRKPRRGPDLTPSF